MERLRRSDAFEAEIRTLLEAHGHPSATIEPVLERLREKRLLNDARVIEGVLLRRSGARARGELAIRDELLRRGAPEEEVNRQLGLLSSEFKQGQMLELLAKKCKISDSRSKAARLLLSRGFQEEEVGGALDAFFGPGRAWDES